MTSEGDFSRYSSLNQSSRLIPGQLKRWKSKSRGKICMKKIIQEGGSSEEMDLILYG